MNVNTITQNVTKGLLFQGSEGSHIVTNYYVRKMKGTRNFRKNWSQLAHSEMKKQEMKRNKKG